MRKPLLTQTFSFLACNHNPQKICRSTLAFFGIAFISLLPIQVIGQCQTNSGQIEGMIFNDHNYDGQQTPGEQGTDLVKVHAYDKTGQLVAEVQPDNDGSYIIDGLTDGDTYRINIELPVYLKSSLKGSDNLTATGFVEAPHCGVNFAVANPVDYCQSPNPDVAVTCFVRGGTGVNDDMPTVVYAPYLFNQNSAISKIAKKGETGSVFGTAWKASTQELFLASFVKQDAFLKDGLGAIYVAKRSQGQFTTQLWAKLGDLGIDAGQSNTNNAENCDYGAQVGKIGIGGIELSHDESLLFVVNLWSKSVVVIDANDPDPSTTMEIPFPMVNCQGGQLRPFAVRHHEGQIYISATCDASDSRTSADHKIAVFTLDYDTKSFTHIFSTSFTRKYWQDSPPDNSTVSHWLTDIEFTDQGHMILGIADRQSHRFCDATPLAGQYPDILMAWNDNGTWKLENNGKVGSLTGSGVGNGQGPGGGEFFGEDYWILGPNYHPEIATGAVFVLPGSDEVVSTVFDPIYSTSSGGFHRYSTINGKKTAAIELYTNNNNVAFGKGSGLGNVIDMCDPAPVQIGNLVWMDENKNGIQDPGEEVVEGLEISLVNTNCEAVEVTTTGSKGEYYFDTGLDYHSSYYVVITDPRYDVSSERLVIDGEELTATIANSGNGIFQNENDSDGTLISGNGCQLLDGHLAIEVQTSGPGYVNHSFDLGLTTEEVIIQQPDTFDLALMKEVVGNDPVKLGQMVDYEITVFNQGQVAASEIQIVEYLPAGLEFSAILNPGWIYQNGELTFTHMGIVDPGSSIKVNITLQITEAADLDDYINYSEISSALDANGDPVQDIDSKPDMIVSNDKGGEPNGPTDNLYDDDGTIDEDDHDPAMVKIFDLALIKTTDFNQTIKIGDEIEFEIEVFNQGQIPATEIEIVDYLPQGLTLSANDNNGWSLVQQGVISTIPGMVNPGESITKSILLEVTGDAQPGQVINFAEISAARDDQGQDMSAFDFDSSPDKEVDNDIGGEPNGPTDNVYNDNGLIDEDDHDPAKLQIYDLALIKSVDKVNVTSTDEDITFHFEIINQGEIATDRVDIVDHIPNGYSFSANDNPNWLKVNSEMLRAALTSSLEPGERAVIPLVLRLSNDGLGKELINYGEIASSVDAFNGQGRDFDSTSDLDKDNDAGGQVNTATDNMINGNGVTDEDDHDPAVIQGVEPMLVDVSLTKTVNTTHVVAGEEVGFTFEITNEEETAIGEIRIVDYLPFFLENIDPEWTLSPNGLYIYKDLRAGDGLPQEGLMNGEIVTTTLQTRILDGIPPGPILNTAEIARLEPYSQNVVAFHDVDSQPDDDPNNDRSNNPKEVIGGAGNDNRPIEDDRAADEVVVCQIERTNICTCLNNESNENNGQFLETVVVTSASGETWYVQEANDIYRDNSPNPPSPPIPFDNGDMLTENTLGGGISTYSISGVFEEGTEWYMIVRNNFDAIHSIQGGQECEYEHPAIIGANSVCINGIEEYEIIPARQGAVYDWNLGSGGSFISGTSGPRVKVQWDDAVSGPHRLTAEEISPDNCTAPATMEVEIGDQFVYSVSCVQEAQISLGNNCVSRVTPQMLLTGGPYDYEAFNVMLSDEHGHPIPDATLTHEHIGKRIMAKVINACTGNSCWAWLTVEDKIGPEIICFNDTVICASMGKYPFPVAIDACDPDPTVRLLNESTEPIDCDPEFIKRVTRRYIAEDQWGNVSDTCVQEIMLRRINTDSIDYPDTFSIANGNPLICNSFKADSNGLPLPEVTGVPMYGDISLWPEEFYCSIGVDYEDIELHRVGCVRKFVREWKIVEWYCTSGFNLIRYPQYIEITDTVAPEVVCPDIEYIVTNTRSCDADVWLDLPEVTDNCSDSFRIDLTYPGGFIKNYKGGKITLPVDTNLIKFRVYDECFNVDSCEFEVIVQDNTPPVAICDQFTTVGLTDTGIAYIYARTFDDGSYDNCKLKTMEVKRMDEGLNCGVVADTFGPYVEFCCEDAGQDVMVIFRVTDKSGNSNTCMVEVEVQDKIPPRIYCPPNDTISCEYHYDTSDLSEFGAPVILDNCEFTLEERVVENVDQCREGYIDRIFIARDENNVSTCVQRIYIINETPFTEDDITWPLDLDTTECREGFLTPDLLPDPYGYPRVEEDICDLVGITFTDHTFPFVDNTEACYKILRKWKIINWCRFDSSEYDTWTYEQVIKVQNETAPVITSSCDKIEKCIYDDCEFGFIELFATATDDCTDESELRWEYHVDLDSDGITDYSDEGFGPRIDIAREFRLGEHNVRFVFEDQCGNKTVCTQFFDLINCKAPSAYCKNGIVVDLIPMDLDGDGECDTEMVEIWARDLDANSFHPCDYPLTYSIGRDTSNKSIIYDCNDLGRREIEICVTTPKGHQSCCNTFVIVQDNNQVSCCPTSIDKDCIIPPADVNLTDCNTSTDPDDLMSFPMTSNCAVDSVVRSFEDEDGTTGDVCQKIIRTWTVELYAGGIDTVCQFTHCIVIDNEFTINDIIWPADTLMLQDCEVDLDTSATGGTPVILGDYCDYVTVDWSDVELVDPDPACRTFQRTWSVVNACENNETFTFEQILEYRNQAPPTLTVPGNITVNSDPGVCEAFVTLPPVEFTECNTGVIVVNDHNGGGANASGVYPVGTTVVTFSASDDCNNVSQATLIVVVEDNEPPTLRCPANMTFDCGQDLEDLDFGDPVASDNCDGVEILMDTIFNLNSCNIGTITRNVIAQDTSGNGAVCVQTITIENMDPFVEGDIDWPEDTVMLSVCDSTGPEFTGEP
ncbi:MAG: SdrD B-like domain-containing protein, partial [Saprospiraceae bacterium]|nr:SdrD B-like domain-containing protein [Saprospiraceae bacterium]